MKPTASNRWRRSVEMAFLVLLCHLVQFPSLNSFSTCVTRTRQCPVLALNCFSALKPSSHAASFGFQTKPRASSLRLRSMDMVAFCLRWRTTQRPSRKPSSMYLLGTLQCPSLALNRSNRTKPYSQSAVIGSNSKPKSSNLRLRLADTFSILSRWTRLQL